MSDLKPCPFCGGEAETLLMMFVKDSYSTATGKPTKKTGLALMRYVFKDKELQRLVNIGDWNSVLKYRSDCNFSNGDEVLTLSQQLAAAKAEIEKLSPLVEIVSNQKQHIQQLEEQLAAAKAEIADISNQLALANLVISHCWVHEGYDMCGASKMTRYERDHFYGVINTRTEDLLAKHKDAE